MLVFVYPCYKLNTISYFAPLPRTVAILRISPSRSNSHSHMHLSLRYLPTPPHEYEHYQTVGKYFLLQRSKDRYTMLLDGTGMGGRNRTKTCENIKTY